MPTRPKHYDTNQEDVVTWLLRLVCDMYPIAERGLSLAIQEVEMETRRRFGGRRCYIAKSSAAEGAALAERREARRGSV